MERPHKNSRGGKTPSNKTTIARKTHARPQHRQNTQRKNLKTHKNKDTPCEPLHRLWIKHSGAKPCVGLVATPRDSGRSRVRIPAGASARFSSAKSGRRLHFIPDATNDMHLPGPPPRSWRSFEAIRHRLGFPWSGTVLLTRRCERGSEHQGIVVSSMSCSCRQPT